MPIRLIDAGAVSPVRSQAVFHGLAYARTDATPDTVVLATPAEPYVCIGFHQDLEQEVDVDFCRRRGLPVLRRETGGGAVYLDRDQLFVQWVMAPESLPARVDRRFEMFAEPLVATYRELGIEATFRPVNDLHVDGRKICGTGAARIGAAEVLVGNFIFDFDTELMARILRAPSAAFRDQVARSLGVYMTSMRRELGRSPDPADVASRYVRTCGETLGDELVPGELSPAEIAAIEEVERRFRSGEFLHRPGGLRRPGVKIHEDVRVVESAVEAEGGGVRVTARMRAGRIEDVCLAAPGEEVGLGGLAEALRGLELTPEPVTRAVREHCSNRRRDAPPGVGVTTWVRAILDLEGGHDR